MGSDKIEHLDPDQQWTVVDALRRRVTDMEEAARLAVLPVDGCAPPPPDAAVVRLAGELRQQAAKIGRLADRIENAACLILGDEEPGDRTPTKLDRLIWAHSDFAQGRIGVADLKRKLEEYERTGDHNHGAGTIAPGQPCNGATSPNDCWVHRVRMALRKRKDARPGEATNG